MPNSFQIIGKAAISIAAFLFLSAIISPALGALPTKIFVVKNQEQTLEQAKKKITSLLLLKQRAQALDLIQEISSSITQADLQKKLSQLKLVVMSSFLSSESQDFFELASSQYLSQSKIALKNAQRCLSVDPDHFLCLWAEAKAISKSNSRYSSFLEKMKALALDVTELKPLILSLDKTQPDFLNLKFDPSRKSELYDSQVLSYILEFDRSMLVKNYLLARESLEKLQQAAPDYIDLIMMKAQLERSNFSSDENIDSLSGVVTVYKKRCQAVSPEIARKYFFDIDFCRRILE